MILTETDYRRALQRLADEAGTLRVQRDHLSGLGLTDDEVKRAVEPLQMGGM